MKPLFTIVLRIILTVNKPTPTKIPYCKEPDKTLTVVFPIPETQTVNKTAETAKQRAELMHMVILNPAFNFDALKSTKTKFNTPQTTARYKRRIDKKSIRNSVPNMFEETSFIREPQFRFNKVLSVKSSKLIFPEAETKGKFTE